MILIKFGSLVCSYLAFHVHASPSLVQGHVSNLNNTTSSTLDSDSKGNISSSIQEKFTTTNGCSGIHKDAAQQAMADAATMAKLLLKNNNWQQPPYQDALTKYMGGNCLTGTYQDEGQKKEYKDWINSKRYCRDSRAGYRSNHSPAVLKNIAKSKWAWYDYARGLIPWVASALGSLTINLYCNDNYPSFSDHWKIYMSSRHIWLVPRRQIIF